MKNIQAEEQGSLRAFRLIRTSVSPYSRVVKRNVIAARLCCRFTIEQECIPLALHLLFPHFLDYDESERSHGLFFGNAIMGKCA